MAFFITEITDGILLANLKTNVFLNHMVYGMAGERDMARYAMHWNGGLVEARHHHVNCGFSAQHTYYRLYLESVILI